MYTGIKMDGSVEKATSYWTRRRPVRNDVERHLASITEAAEQEAIQMQYSEDTFETNLSLENFPEITTVDSLDQSQKTRMKSKSCHYILIQSTLRMDHMNWDNIYTSEHESGSDSEVSSEQCQKD